MAKEKDIADSYNKFKKYKGKQYSGMKIGRSHKWNYDQGVWKEQKVTPDAWNIGYSVTKRRVGNAPKNSGAPVGTEYNWLIVARQKVKKLNANDYSTQLNGHKFKIAHKRYDREKWSPAAEGQRKKLIKYLEQVIAELKAEDEAWESRFTTSTKTQDNMHESVLKLKTVAELNEMAADLEVQNRSKMKKAELVQAVMEASFNGKGSSADSNLNGMTKEELYELAQERNISGRSKMKKKELIEAIAR